MKTLFHNSWRAALLTTIVLSSCQQKIHPAEDITANSQKKLQYVKLNESDAKPSLALGEEAPILLTGRNKQEAWEAAKKMAPLNNRLKEDLTPEQVGQLEKEYLTNFEEGSGQELTARLFFAVKVLDQYWLEQPASTEKTERVNYYANLFYENQYGDPMLTVRILDYLKDRIASGTWHGMAQEFLLRGKAITAAREASVTQQQHKKPATTPMGQALDDKQRQYVEIRKQELVTLENMLVRNR